MGKVGQYAFERHRETGNEGDLHAAIDASLKALAETRRGDPARAERLAMLAASLHMRYALTQSRADLDEATVAAEAAVARLPENPSDRAYCLSALMQVQVAQFERSGQLPDLERAEETQRRAAAASRPTIQVVPHPRRTWPCS